MKLLLTAINTKYIHSNLAVYSLKAYHDNRSDCKNDIEIAEYTINQYTDDIIRSIYLKRPDIIAFSCYLWNIDYVYEISLELSKLFPGIDIWLGGPEVTYDSRQVLRDHPWIRGVMVGEGEQTFLELMKCYEAYESNSERTHLYQNIAKVEGIALRYPEEYVDSEEYIILTRPRALLNLDELPFVYQDLTAFENKIIYYESSRGCPFGCSYCLSSVEKSVRFRSLSLVFKELQYFLDHKVSQVKFVDRTFNVQHDRTLQLLEFIQKSDNGITNFHFEIAADLLKQDEIDLIKKMRPGLIQLEIGVQSSNLATIKEIDRTMDLSILSDVVTQINQGQNVHQHLDLIAGLPYENMESFIRSFNYVYDLKPEQLQLGFLKVLKGSKMYRNAKEYGIVYKEKSPYEVMYTKWISYDDILVLKKVEEMVELHYNSHLYEHTIDFVIRFFPSAYAFYQELGDYYEQNGYFEVKHTRMTRYHIFYDFLIRSCEKYQELEKHRRLLSDILVFDLYLRENLKTRPAFSINLDDKKEIIRNLYQFTKADKSAHIEPIIRDTLRKSYVNLPVSEYTLDQFIEEISVNQKGNSKIVDRLLENKDLLLSYDWVLFDYQNKSPLDHNAAATIIRILEKSEEI